MFKNRRMQLLKVFCLVVFLINVSCANKNVSLASNSIKKSQLLTKNNKKLQGSNPDSIYLDKDKLVIKINGAVKNYEDLVINAMALTTSLKVIDKNTFYLIYEYNASVTKVKDIYKYIYKNGLFLIFKETIKLYNNESGAKRFYLKDLEIIKQNFDILESLGDTIQVKYQKNQRSDLTRLYNHQGQNIGEIGYRISGVDRFIESPLLSLDDNVFKNFTIKNVIELNNTAFFLEQSGDYKEAVFILEKIVNEYPMRAVAHLNLADSHWSLNNKMKAKGFYQKYTQLMKTLGKENKIPKRVLKRLNN